MHAARRTPLSVERLALAGLAILVHLTITAQLAISFTTSDYNGYQVSCFGQKDGAIDATVSGGTAPYSYTWSTARPQRT